MSDDVKKFEEALTDSSAPNKGSSHDRHVFLDAPPRDTAISTNDGVAQYIVNGSGYTFAAKTVEALPSGIYNLGFINERLSFIPAPTYTDTLIRLPDTRSDLLLQEITKFWGLKRTFKEGNEKAHGGFVHKRGYLLFGPPGSGKTSTVQQVLQAIVESGGIALLVGMPPEQVAFALKNFRTVEPDRNVVVVFEDFDDMISNYGESGFLSLLDGEDSIGGALFLATTNYVSRFDARMYARPGRFSDVVYVGMPSIAAREVYLRAKLRDHSDVPKILELTDGFGLDHLRTLILGVYFEGKELEAEAERLRKLFKPPKDNPSSVFGISGGIK